MKEIKATKQLGFGALEVMIALLVGALAIVGAIGWYQKLMSSNNNQDELSNVTSIITNTRNLRTTSGYGTSGTNLLPALNKAGGIPDAMSVSSSNVVSNAWGGTVTVTSNGTWFTVSYNGVPDENCVFLATKGAISKTIQTSINGGSTITGEVTAAQANSGCSTDSNTISWITR